MTSGSKAARRVLTPRPGHLPLAWETHVDPADVILHVSLDWEPKSKGRPRMSRARFDDYGNLIQGHAYTPTETRHAEEDLGWVFRAMRRVREPTKEMVGVLCFCRTKGWSKDGSNMYKLAEDAMNGIIYEDDKQVGEHHVHYLPYCTEPGLDLLVWLTRRRVPGG